MMLIPSEAWPAILQGGFSAVLVLLLLWREGQAFQRMTDSINRLSRAITSLILAMAWLPKIYHEEAREIEAEIHDSEVKRKSQK